MKKRYLLITLFVLCSCQNNQNSLPFKLEDKYYTKENKGLVEINDINLFKNLEKNNESFGVYIYLSGCLTCQKFKPILTEFLDINNIQLYSISYTLIKESKNTLHSNIEYAPSVALFNDGKLITYLDSINNDHIEYYENLDGFTSWFTNYVEIQ